MKICSKIFIFFCLLCIISLPIFYHYIRLFDENLSQVSNKNTVIGSLNSTKVEHQLNLLKMTSSAKNNNKEETGKQADKLLQPSSNLLNQQKNDLPFYDTSHLTENTIYKRFNIVKPKHKKRVGIVVIIQSAPREFERRQSIRNTWLQDCVSNENITAECFFITDQINNTSPLYTKLQNETSQYGDMRFQNVASGIQFGMRLLFQLVYASLHYEFDYFLRIDDDYFFCLGRYIAELYPTPLRSFVVGWVHCIDKIVRPDEGFLLFSREIVHKFVAQNESEIMCTAYGGQNVGIWLMDLKLKGVLYHDRFLHHTPTVQEKPSLKLIKNVCDKYSGIHGAYPGDMEILWGNRGSGDIYGVSRTLFSHCAICSKKYVMNWQVFAGKYKQIPKRCIENPIYKGSHPGRKRV